MNEVKWNDRFNLGVDMIDKAHQKLFSIVGKLISLNEDIEKQQHACREGVKYLKNYTIKHFAEEEAYMSYINYSGYEMHKKLHANMRDNTLPALEKELNRQNYSVESVRHFLGICIGWLNTHVMIEDHAITGRTVNKWIHDSSDDITASLEKAVIQAAQDLFRLKAQIVSKHYSGEDFSSGQMLCYRLTYLSPKQERSQVYLIYEKKLVLRVLGEMLGKTIKSTDKTIAYAVKILTQHFMERIETHFSPQHVNTLERNDMLTFEQFLAAFDKAYPPYSLLFNTTGKGYFALCINKK
ncbi:MAG: hypothetical protein HFI75_11975 [Lachnospiraceae bacterium]|nr:hypothetical protein [Lachnospiraceae bacterium]